jgi:hypothetical protein
MRFLKKHGQEFEEPHKHERFMLFLCFLATALAGYVVMNHVALLGV